MKIMAGIASLPIFSKFIGKSEVAKPIVKIAGSSTNSPYLRPFYANQYDISYERYFEDTDGAFIAALFYKDIESFVQTCFLSSELKIPICPIEKSLIIAQNTKIYKQMHLG